MTQYPDDEDGAVLTEMAEQGVDMTQPIQIDFFVAAPDEETATDIAELLEGRGYEVEVCYDDGEPDENGEVDPDDEEFGPAWTVFVKRKMVPTYDQIMQIQAELSLVVTPLGGEQDGWGAMME